MDESRRHCFGHLELSPNNLYVACSKRAPLTPEQLRELSAWVNGTPYSARPLPSARLGLVHSSLGLRLHRPDAKPFAWHPGMALRRMQSPNDALPTAMNLKTNDVVLDCTLGMGHDALVLASNGAKVIGMDERPEFVVFTLSGIWNFSETLARQIHGLTSEHSDYLASQEDNTVDHVYLDPMFPRQLAGKSSTWATMRAMVHRTRRLDESTLRDARRVARKSVVLKLAPQEPAPNFEGFPPARVHGSRRVYFAVWDDVS